MYKLTQVTNNSSFLKIQTAQLQRCTNTGAAGQRQSKKMSLLSVTFVQTSKILSSSHSAVDL